MSGRLGDDQPNEAVLAPVIPTAPNTGPAPPEPQQRVAEAETGTVWRMDASVNLPQQAAPSLQDFVARLTATAGARTQPFRFCSAEEVAGDIKNEFARYLAAVQTPEAILACAGESIPALKNYIFQVLKSGAAPPEGEATPQTVLESMRAFDLYWLRCTADSETGSTAPRLLRLKQSSREAGFTRVVIIAHNVYGQLHREFTTFRMFCCGRGPAAMQPLLVFPGFFSFLSYKFAYKYT